MDVTVQHQVQSSQTGSTNCAAKVASGSAKSRAFSCGDAAFFGSILNVPVIPVFAWSAARWQIEWFAPAKNEGGGCWQRSASGRRGDRGKHPKDSGLKGWMMQASSLQILFCLMHMSSCVSLFSVTCKSMESMAHLLCRQEDLDKLLWLLPLLCSEIYLAQKQVPVAQ